MDAASEAFRAGETDSARLVSVFEERVGGLHRTLGQFGPLSFVGAFFAASSLLPTLTERGELFGVHLAIAAAGVLLAVRGELTARAQEQEIVTARATMLDGLIAAEHDTDDER